MILTELSGNLERLLDVQQVDFLDIELPVIDPNQSFTTLGGSANLTFNYVSLTRTQIDRLLTESLGKTPFVFGLTNNKFIAFPFWFYTPLDLSSTSTQYGSSVGHVIWNYCRYGRDTLPTLKVYDSVEDAISADYNSWGNAWYVTPDSNRRNITEIQYMRFGFAHDKANKALYITMQMRVKDANGGIAYYTVGSSGATQLGANSSVDFGTPPAPQRGYYHGAIDGGTPARQFMRGGIDYLRTIDIYDETYYTHGSNAAFLKNRVGELPYNGVEFAYPNIIVKANTSIQFTHAVTASWSADNRPVVYEVIGYHEIGNNLAEYTLRVDGVKTFFQYHTNFNPLIGRHSNSANWSKWMPDSALYDGTFSRQVLRGSTIDLKYCMVYKSKVIAFSKEKFEEFCDWLTFGSGAQYAQNIIGQISRLYIAPYTADNTCYTGVSGNIQFYYDPTDSSSFVEFEAGSYHLLNYYTSSPSIFYDLYVQGTINSGLNIITDQSYLYDSMVQMHIPCYGDFTPTADTMQKLSEGSLHFKYAIDALGGTCSVMIETDRATSGMGLTLPAVALPSLTLPVNSGVAATLDINRAEHTSVIGSVIGAVGATVTGAISGASVGGAWGALGGTAVGVSSGAASVISTIVGANNQKAALLERNTVTSVSASGGASIVSRMAHVVILYPNLVTNYNDYYSIVGYPCGKLLNDCLTASGDVIWPVWNKAKLNDKPEIVEDLIAKSAEGIYWNP